MTPWQLSVAVEGYNEHIEQEHKNRGWLAWHIAALTRTKKMPSLKRMMSDEKQKSKNMNDDDKLHFFKALSQKRK
jgi:hypothetical protein